MLFRTGLLLAFFSASSAFAITNCAELNGCQEKQCEIEAKIDSAQKAGNQLQLAGLNKALSENKTYCNDADVKQEIQQKIKETQADLNEYRADLVKAKAQRKSDKVEKYQRKIDEQEKVLMQLMQSLADLQE